ncbi:ATP-dependent helicase [Corynebacterium macginleyi]|uniref:ATP-dependent helicase n=1 Tax=Corynebacterium macginleyi TaxID=38290 RepID=UPI000EF99111|nr:UvrD-helicase domain-containing protein [Corynebacterium macginleyi]MBK4181407.1 UvrD-helicase domain-containing protein [Corynebacterium macginleyi]QRJ59556.1 ATP-dependent helicase [Corynebacterium macginleyi]RMB67812.1 ATP-dependent helicase [Corynebacterium macginleyi]
MSKQNFSPEEIAQALGKDYPPTKEQAHVIKGSFGPKLVVAGAGAGKTETMASRVVYLVANGYVRPEEVLGLTFTRKAAQQLEQRIRRQLIQLRDSGLIVPGSPAAEALNNIAPTVATYDSYAGELVREYGLLVPVEPSARIITEAERFAIAYDVVKNYGGQLSDEKTLGSITETLLKITSDMDNSLKDPDDIAEFARDFRADIDNLEKAPRTKGEYSKDLQKYINVQDLRVQYVPLIEELKRAQAEQQVITFGEQMSVAARLAQEHPAVGKQQAQRYRVIMLDEYQDTSYAQRVLLRSLFGGEQKDISVTAVGDPMQAIYGWRGATSENLTAFVEDFPQADGTHAPKDQLTTSWRNPSGALELANSVAAGVFAGGPRPVDELHAAPHKGEGEIELAYFASEDKEHEFIAQKLRQQWDAREGDGFSAAVLVRTNRQTAAIAAALDAVDVPNEINGLGGLLWQPEIQDLVALATLLVRPEDAQAALRIFAGPMCGLGMGDIQALAARQKNLAGAKQERLQWEEGMDPEQYLRAQLAQLTAEAPDQMVGLADALADLGERDRYTPQGLARMEEVSAKLRYLRTYSLPKPLSDLFADIEAIFNIRTEVLARGSAGGATHLDKFADIVAGFHGDSLYALLDYLKLAREHEDGLELGEVPASTDRVQIMTVHKAKGLEWEHVYVVHADSSSYKAQAETFLSKIEKVPGEDDYIEVSPDAVTRSEFEKACKAFVDDDRAHNAEEAARLFYVALTRTESTLTVTGSGTNNRSGKAKKGPYEYLERLKESFPQYVVEWTVPEKPVETSANAAESGLFPALEADPDALAGAEAVLSAMENLPELSHGETFELWEQDAGALIEEYKSLQQPVVDVELPSELTASDMVALGSDPLQFARRQRRPVPFKPNSYAKRGTAFHAWLEERFGSPVLLGEEELPGINEPEDFDLEELKESFLNSEWAERQPDFVEAPFEITIGSAVVRGRMDAVFRLADGTWMVVDWKTGRPPKGAAMEAAKIQLAVYAEAWRRIHGGDKIRAAFHYVHDGYTFEPDTLARGEELRSLLESSVTGP